MKLLKFFLQQLSIDNFISHLIMSSLNNRPNFYATSKRTLMFLLGFDKFILYYLS